MVVGEADRRDRQLRHQVVADVDVVIPSQDQVQNIAADVGCRADVLSKSILDENVSSVPVRSLCEYRRKLYNAKNWILFATFLT